MSRAIKPGERVSVLADYKPGDIIRSFAAAEGELQPRGQVEAQMLRQEQLIQDLTQAARALCARLTSVTTAEAAVGTHPDKGLPRPALCGLADRLCSGNDDLQCLLGTLQELHRRIEL